MSTAAGTKSLTKARRNVEHLGGELHAAHEELAAIEDAMNTAHTTPRSMEQRLEQRQRYVALRNVAADLEAQLKEAEANLERLEQVTPEEALPIMREAAEEAARALAEIEASTEALDAALGEHIPKVSEALAAHEAARRAFGTAGSRVSLAFNVTSAIHLSNAGEEIEADMRAMLQRLEEAGVNLDAVRHPLSGHAMLFDAEQPAAFSRFRWFGAISRLIQSHRAQAQEAA